ncbi:hypothetical protein B0H15DRAFT_349221 [Mycena belliarum]|uniref:Uncharacterized protein n=1 Tax=Mycena belliarum TaxID=1033014 RepID=A0AAD6U6I2_9AGAR|nr:hypothetical protein B0H15DRAFT_349221 [Mycena belliae]
MPELEAVEADTDRTHWIAATVENKPTWALPGPFTVYAWSESDEVEWGPSPLTLWELAMYELSWALRSKPEWQRKAADPEIRAKWRKEALEQKLVSGDDGDVQTVLTEKMVDYVLAELEGYAKISDNEKGIERGCFDAIWYSDQLIFKEVEERLKNALEPLENVPEDQKDWHPGSNRQVLDLVHPSLYCVVYGRTHAYLPGKPRIASNFLPMHAPKAEHRWTTQWTSQKFCWLPSDFAVDAKDGSVRLVSPYINNINPMLHQPLYRVIEEVIARFIPMFERVLGDTNRENDRVPFSSPDRLGQISCIWGEGEQPYPDDEPGTDEHEDEFMDTFYASFDKTLPDAEEYKGALEARLAPVSLHGRTIQCIIKLASIHLSPEHPEYAGGSWHVEGMTNESIAASGIYYYDEDNITESKLEFRVPTGEPVYHGQDDIKCMQVLYGKDRDSVCIQEIGAMVTKAGRALAWPNLFQHCVSPFKLVDPSKPGHRKILAIFLVNPTLDPIVSATNVPPQQAEWAGEAFEQAVAASDSVLGDLAPELRDLIKGHFPSTVMRLGEAEAYRLQLMKERTAFVADHTAKAYGKTFNMCEH